MQRLKLTREFVSSYLRDAIPEYEEMLVFIENNGGWVCPPPKISEWLGNLKIHDYPMLYRGEEMIYKALLLSFMPVDQINELGVELENLPDIDQTQVVEELIKSICEGVDEGLECFPDTPEKIQAAQKSLSELSAEGKDKAFKQTQLLIAAFLAMFHNSVSIMVHGRPLTDLVQAAEAGDDDAFRFAVQIDKRILSALPYFRERQERAIAGGDVDFLDKLHYRLTSPLLRGKIRYPGLYMLFGILESIRWLDELEHEEILDICDRAGLDLYQNRIEDVNYLTKRLVEYCKWRIVVSLSMQ